MRDHEPLVIGSFRGTFDRGEDDTCPIGFFTDSKNIRFIKGGVKTRYGSAQSITIATVKRAAVYKIAGQAQRLLILDNTGKLYDSTNLVTPILNIAAMTDFSMVSIFDRAYITPHDGVTGLPGEKVYVYTGAGVARTAAGTAPSGFTLGAADSAGSGSVEAGIHIFGVAYETASGFITAPGGFKEFTSVGSKKVDLSLLPIGGSSVVARLIVATKKLAATAAGDFDNQTYFLVPGGRVGNNVDTTVTVNFFNADLSDDATYLLEEVAEIPAGVGIGLYRGRMIVWGENANQAVVRVSTKGKPESFNSVEGFITVNPGDSGGGVKNCTEYRNQLLMCKSQRTYFSVDNDNEAAFWEVGSIDMSVGTECHGFGRSLDFGENIEDHLFVADRAGLRLFNGIFSEVNVLTYNIDDIWGRINEPYFNTVEVAVDPIEALIYIAVPLDASTAPNVILFGDYSEGLSLEAIRWTVWDFPKDTQTVVVDVVSSVTVMKFGAPDGNIYAMDTALTLDFNNAIESYTEFPFLPFGEFDDVINHFTGVRLRVKGSGILQITGKGLDSGATFTASSIILSASPGKPYFKGFNFVSERCSVKLRMNLVNEEFILTRFVQFVTPIWEGRAE